MSSEIDQPPSVLGESRTDQCGGCGGPYRFDTSVPSVVWNAVIRKARLSEYLCLACIVEAFAKAGQSFTATLWTGGGGVFAGLPIEVIINGQSAKDATAVSDENTALRVRIRELEGGAP